MTLPAYDPAEPIAAGRTVIEASAGTGKTFTIAATVTRLVAAEGVELERIVAITFTRAATGELRSRVRRRMVDTLAFLEGSSPVDPDAHMRALAGAGVDPGLMTERLGRALVGFDRAQIFTIHGFARRLLARLGFRARLPAHLEPETLDDLILTQTAGDLVIARFAHHPPDEVPPPGQVADLGRAVVSTPDAAVVPDPSRVEGAPRHRAELAAAMAGEVPRRMRLAGSATFDDALLEVVAALDDPETEPAVHRLLHLGYDVALVDEAQDTDPTQWSVIRRVFDGLRLVMIGDPKQSIYSFRGADVEAYLGAVADADTTRTLMTNWRSDGPLLTALDTLFDGTSLGHDDIRHRPVEPAPDHRSSRVDDPGPPLTIRRITGDAPIRRGRRGFYVTETRRAVAADTAAEVVRLLDAGITRDGPGGPRPLGAADIAVLCRTRNQVELIRTELERRRVPSVAARTGGVFATPAAEEWRRFLLAVERPERTDRVRLAATTLLVGRTPAEMATIDDDELLALQGRMRSWRDLLHAEGLPAVIERLGRVTDLAGRVLATRDGERMMTDLTHIAEEMHVAWRRGRTGSLVGWLETTMAEAVARSRGNVEEPETRQRRLETDADAVEVQTIHGAKGLQFPVVLVPFAWDVPPMKPSIPVFHDPEGAGGRRRRLIDVGGETSPGFADHVAAARAENEAEDERLLYVALTRAEHRLVVWWVEGIERTERSKLHELLTGDGRSPEGLVAAGGGAIAVTVADGEAPSRPHHPPDTGRVALEPARFDRSLDHRWRRVSFTTLSPDQPLTASAGTVETPEHRGDELPADGTDHDPLATGADLPSADFPSADLPLAEMPGGARFGNLVHHVLEHVVLDAPEPQHEVRRVVDTELQRSRWDLDADRLVTGLAATLETPLGPEDRHPRLRDLSGGDVLHELRFELPVRTGGAPLTLGEIASVMTEHLPADDPYHGYAADLAGSGVPFRGYLTGAIDVVAALPLPGGVRYVVMDYKSNTLPVRGEAPGWGDYGPGPMIRAMVEGNYVLQATLYQVALHRYLQWRVPGYRPERDLGGAVYLFLRGMTGAGTPVVDGERCGVARWRPPAGMVVALSRLLSGGEG